MDVQQDCEITPTPEQAELLSQQRNIHNLEALRTADFLGRQDYINNWIKAWFKSTDIDPESLPLCISETIYTNNRIQKKYMRILGACISRNNMKWVQTHYIVHPPTFKPWNYVIFENITWEMWQYLWKKTPVPFDDGKFMTFLKDLNMWKMFVDFYGPTDTIEYAIRNEWLPGVQYCIDQGADIENKDVVRYCVRKADIFKYVTQVPTLATKEAYSEFILQIRLGRIQDIPLVEQWFFCHGFPLISNFKHNLWR